MLSQQLTQTDEDDVLRELLELEALSEIEKKAEVDSAFPEAPTHPVVNTISESKGLNCLIIQANCIVLSKIPYSA